MVIVTSLLTAFDIEGAFIVNQVFILLQWCLYTAEVCPA